ncbi:hypothetical protein ACLOJK_033019 [Asimina triloba]
MSAKPHPPLHNFSLPLLKWGSQRFLRCMKTDPAVDRDASQSNGSAASPTRPPPAAPRKPSTPASLEKLRTPPRIGAADPDGESVTDDGIEEIRERLLDHLRSAADKMRFRVPEEEESAAMPWNLRTRRAANKAPAEMGSAAASFSPPPPPPPPPPVVPESQLRSMRSRSAAAAAAAAAVQKEKPKEKRKLTVALSKEEIEEDFLLMTGSRPARRPKKRLGKVQRQLDAWGCFTAEPCDGIVGGLVSSRHTTIIGEIPFPAGDFPGLWLSDITVEAYRVPESHEKGKR